jgi:hypothetical protein
VEQGVAGTDPGVAGRQALHAAGSAYFHWLVPDPGLCLQAHKDLMLQLGRMCGTELEHRLLLALRAVQHLEEHVHTPEKGLRYAPMATLNQRLQLQQLDQQLARRVLEREPLE